MAGRYTGYGRSCLPQPIIVKSTFAGMSRWRACVGSCCTTPSCVKHAGSTCCEGRRRFRVPARTRALIEESAQLEGMLNKKAPKVIKRDRRRGVVRTQGATRVGSWTRRSSSTEISRSGLVTSYTWKDQYKKPAWLRWPGCSPTATCG